MLVVKIELHSANTGAITEIANMVIANDGTGSVKKGNYWGKTFKKGHSYYTEYDKEKPQVLKEGSVKDYSRNDLHVWNLVARMLQSMGYK